MAFSDRSQAPRGQALPSLQQILSPNGHPDSPDYYTPRSRRSPPIPSFSALRSPRESTLPLVRGSTYYQSYQAPPLPPRSSGRGYEADPPRHLSPFRGRFPSISSSDHRYGLSSEPGTNRDSFNNAPLPPLQRQEGGQGPADSIVGQRRPSFPEPQQALGLYPSPQPSHGSTPRTPRVIDERYVTGEGLCYFYEDGTRCQKYIDGEGVNPHWGVTKAGKPRKRLAQACTTCREKKIKCDPGSPKCIQCQKFGRECRFENAPRGHHHLSINFTPNVMKPGEYEHSGQMPHHQRRDSDSTTTHQSLGPGPLKRPYDAVTLGGPSGEQGSGKTIEEIISKRQRRGSASSHPESTSQPSKRFKGKLMEFERNSENPNEDGLKVDAVTLRTAADWKTDPWSIDAPAATYHINLYFDHVNTATYCMFPRKPFMEWCQTSQKKSPDDKMLVYSLLAMGAIFSDGPERNANVKKLSNIAEYAVQNSFGKFSLQLAQARLILALLNFALGHSTKAWDHCGSALRVACGLKFNIEEGVTDVNDDENLDYGLERPAIEECQRRTFWSAFIMDRFNGFCSGHLSVISISDCFLRLPHREDAYEDQVSVPTPYFQNTLIDPTLCHLRDPSSRGSMAHLVNISATWGETLAFIYRCPFYSPSTFPQTYESHHASTMTQLSYWNTSLPPHLTWSQKNLDSSIRQGYIGTFISLHSLYHCTILKLNRHLPWHHIPREDQIRNIRLAHNHARALLQGTRALARMDRENRLKQITPAFSTPFTGYAIQSAVDILSAGGSMAELPETIKLVDSGLEVIEELATFWSSAKGQFRYVGSRLKDLMETFTKYGGATASPSSSSSSASGRGMGENVAFVMSEAIEATFGRENDLIYAMDRRAYLAALGIDLGGNAGVVMVNGSGFGRLSGEYL